MKPQHPQGHRRRALVPEVDRGQRFRLRAAARDDERPRRRRGAATPRSRWTGRRLAATTVLFDPKRDVAVLYVPGLAAHPLPFATTPGAAGDSAIVIGYPRERTFHPGRRPHAGPHHRARRRHLLAVDVTREIYGLRSQVLPGNSGGPLMTRRPARSTAWSSPRRPTTQRPDTRSPRPRWPPTPRPARRRRRGQHPRLRLTGQPDERRLPDNRLHDGCKSKRSG